MSTKGKISLSADGGDDSWPSVDYKTIEIRLNQNGCVCDNDIFTDDIEYEYLLCIYE